MIEETALDDGYSTSIVNAKKTGNKKWIQTKENMTRPSDLLTLDSLTDDHVPWHRDNKL